MNTSVRIWAITVAAVASTSFFPSRSISQNAAPVVGAWTTYADSARHFRFEFPETWKTDPTSFTKEHYTTVFICLNSMGTDHFGSLINQNVGRTIAQGHLEYPAAISDLLPPGGVYLDVGWQEGPPAPRFGSNVHEMEAADLTSVMGQAVEYKSADGQLFTRRIGFQKWGRSWVISVYLRSPVSTDSRETVDRILRSFRFDGVPAGDEIWAIGEARKHLPPEAHPEEFVREGGNEFRNVTTRKEGTSVIVTFTTQDSGQQKKVWEYRVTDTGAVIERKPDAKETDQINGGPILLRPATTGEQSASAEADSWGKPVQGVQLRLVMPGASTPGPFPPLGLPALEMQIRNGGSGPVGFSWDWLSCGSAIEIDGVWYYSGSCAGNGAAGPALVPGASSKMIPLEFQSLTTDGKTLITPKDLNLGVGKHTVRAKTPMSNGVEDLQGQTLILTSNLVTFEIGPG